MSRQCGLGNVEKASMFKGVGLMESRSLKPREGLVRDYGQGSEKW